MREPFFNLYDIIFKTGSNINKKLQQHVFSELGSNDPSKLFDINDSEDVFDRLTLKKIIYHDQEPIMFNAYKEKWANRIYLTNRLETNHLLGNSEKNSVEKDNLLKASGWHDFYWFSNGFLSLEWYRYYKYATYLENSWTPTKTFSSYNRILPHREHRLAIANHLYTHYPKKIILSRHFGDDAPDNLFVNTTLTHSENLSYTIHEQDFIDSFCHIVTERIFFENRIHLTEKIFRPIVCCRPFILVSSPGALSYLKGYGFKTFGDFWSEDYDNIKDHNKRLAACIETIDEIASMSKKRMLEMLNEMKDILLYNRKHFYNNFEKMITVELYDNLTKAMSAKNETITYYEQIINSLTPSEIDFIRNHPKTCDPNDPNMFQVYSYIINNIIGDIPDEDIIRPYIRDKVEYFNGYLLGVDYLNQTKGKSLR